MKKSLAVVGAVALAGVLAVTAAGCSSSRRNLASLSSNWYYNSSFKRIQPTFTEDAKEKLTYTVTHTPLSDELKNGTYSVEYPENGTYITEFYAKQVTEEDLADITTEDWREGYKNALGKDGMYLYYYTTTLTLPKVTYKCGSEEETFINQSVVTESYFFSVEDYLRPVYSKRVIDRAIPGNLQAAKLNETYSQVNMTYESFYSLSGDSVITQISGTYTDNGKEKDATETFTLNGLNDHANSVFDVAYLDITIRAMRNIAGTFSQTIGIYSPGLQVRDYTVASSNKAILDDSEQAALQLAIFEGILSNKGMYTPDSEDDSHLQTAAVSIAYNGGSYSGVSQTYWFAVSENNNQTRTLMVKYSEPLTYNLGRLDYVLTKIGE